MSDQQLLSFKVQLDTHQLPEQIEWFPDTHEPPKTCKSVMIALWDEKEGNTLRIDLWTKTMSIDEMRIFYHQNMLSMADAYARATGDQKTSTDVKSYLEGLGKRMGILKD